MQFGKSEDFYGYNLTDLESDVRLINKSLFRYKAKENFQIELYINRTSRNILQYFTDRIKSYSRNITVSNGEFGII